MATSRLSPVLDQAPAVANLRDQVVIGLSRAQKTLPAMLFYDSIGSRLFDRICELPEYYLTRAEAEILDDRAHEIARRVGPGCVVIEYGAGSGSKTRQLLRALHIPAGYVAIDIARRTLEEATSRLAREFPTIPVMPICADFQRPIEIASFMFPHRRRLAFFPGSTIGNLEPREAIQFLKSVANVIGADGAALIGVDLVKDPDVLERAYADAQGVTAAFNKNALLHANAALGADFDVDSFAHVAIWNEAHERVEMHLVALREQHVHVGDHAFRFRPEESIHTENSYKYTPARFAELAAHAGLAQTAVFLDSNERFADILLEPAAHAAANQHTLDVIRPAAAVRVR